MVTLAQQSRARQTHKNALTSLIDIGVSLAPWDKEYQLQAIGWQGALEQNRNVKQALDHRF